MTSGAEAILFWCIAPLTVLAALGLIFARKAVHATVCMVFVMISLAVLYIANEAPFLGIVQIVVYTGAVMMLFLFVIMLVGVDTSDSLVETLKGQRFIGWLLGIGLGIVLITFLGRMTLSGGMGHQATVDNNPAELARVLLGNFVFPLELVGILLVTAAIAALTMTHKRKLAKRIGQKELADARVASGARLTPLPSPGVFAQRNAMDVPALDPHGKPVESSVSRVLRARGQDKGPIYDPDIELLDEAGKPAPSTWERTGSAATPTEADHNTDNPTATGSPADEDKEN
ncbi:NADH-quinone oxidoreductase subunit J [Timonella sp. A28]|uniref:NADH-quinone oxidoreductase subunit J n=1 Tax=Timonella sp. A28 TaxID=3442640 RepID=UPI003EBCDE2C